MNLLELAVYALATWRLSSLLVAERGPWNVFQSVRARAGIGHDESGNINVIPDTFMAGLLSCLWCASVWIGAAVAAAAYALPAVTFSLCLPLALSAAAIGFEGLLRR